MQILKFLERTPPDQLSPGSQLRAVALVEALYEGHKARYDAAAIRLHDYRKEIESRTNKITSEDLAKKEYISGETTHFSVVDASGLLVGVTASINSYFGARVANTKLGFLYNDYMQEFEIDDPRHPYTLRPGAMPYSSMCPTVLAKGDKAFMVLGSPGSSRSISTISQVIQLWVDAGLGIQKAISNPRIHTIPDGRRIYFESLDTPSRVITHLQKSSFIVRGAPMHLANNGLNPYFGGVHALAREMGTWRGAADPRRDGVVRCVNP